MRTRVGCFFMSKFKVIFNKNPTSQEEFSHRKYYQMTVVMYYLLLNIEPDNTWIEDLKSLLQKYPVMFREGMGFKENWEVSINIFTEQLLKKTPKEK